MSVWPILTASFLILLKAGIKLYAGNKPTLIDHIKAAAVLPVDVSFLIVALLIKHLDSEGVDVQKASAYIVGYILISLLITVLWRVSDSSVDKERYWLFGLLFPFNLAVSGTAFYLALTFLK